MKQLQGLTLLYPGGGLFLPAAEKKFNSAWNTNAMVMKLSDFLYKYIRRISAKYQVIWLII